MERGFLAALDPALIAGLITLRLLPEGGARVVSAQPGYVRYKRGDGALVGYRVELERAGRVATTFVTVRCGQLARLRAEAAALAPRAKQALSDLVPFAVSESEEVLLLAFPIDRELRGLRDLVRASRLRDVLSGAAPGLVPDGLRISKSRSELEVVRFKPERRAVLRWRLALVDSEGVSRTLLPIWVRNHAGEESRRAFLAQSAAARVGVPSPVPIASPSPNVAFEHELDLGPTRAQELGAVGECLARLHRAEVPGGLVVHDLEAELALVRRAASDLQHLAPEFADLAAGIAEDLRNGASSHRGAAARTALLHGDFHAGQIVSGSRGIGLVDFDRSCIGAPEFDLASHAAQAFVDDSRLDRSESSALVAGYRAGGGSCDDGFLAWARACALVRTASTPFRRLDPRWIERVGEILDHARQALAETAS